MHLNRFRSLVFVFSLIVQAAKAQFFSFSPLHNVPVMQDGAPIALPWTGSYNCGQFWPCDMNNDTIEDLLLYDKASGRTLVFLAVADGFGSYSWTYAPDYESLIPEMESWLATADFNCDGRKDLFTQTDLGIKVFRNEAISPNQTGFILEVDGLRSIGFSGIINVQVNPYGAPSFLDVDNDGDLDVLTFDFNGNTVEYHKNLVIENQGQCAGFQLKKDSCVFGLFATQSICGTIKLNTTCYGQRPAPVDPVASQSRIMHLGSQMCALDLDGDGDKDILVGDLGCSILSRLVNGGSPTSAHFISMDTLFPSAGQRVKLSTFPSAYQMDLNFDQKPDLVITPTSFGNEADNNVINTRGATHLYVNNSTTQVPDYQLTEKDFMQNQMIDVGEESTPVFADIDADGDQDLLIGHRGWKIGENLVAGLFLYRNDGTILSPSFQLESTDYLNLSSLTSKRLKPLVHDFNNDGAPDLGWMSSPGEPTNTTTTLKVLLNQAGAGQPWSFPTLSNAVEVPFIFGPYDSPVFTDVDGDQAWDMILGKYNGRAQLWKQTAGWPNLQFQLMESNYGNLKHNSSSVNPNLALSDANRDGKPDLVVGDNSGIVKLYRSFKDQPATQFPADSTWYYNLADASSQYKVWGKFSSPALADLNGDNFPEMAVGTTGGGILLFVNRMGPNAIQPKLASLPWKVWPNPTSVSSLFKWAGPSARQISVYNAQGVRVHTYTKPGPSLPLPDLPAGLYFLHFAGENQTSVLRLEIQ